ncbi:MAG: endopeptidase La [Bacilli bacterium]|nr:endopeptidase La [Bacilli bacterium]
MVKINLPVIILRGIILLPNNDIKLEFDNDVSKNIIDIASMFHNNNILVVTQLDTLEENPNINELQKYGVVAKISHKIELPNGKIRIVLTGINRAKVIEYLSSDSLESIIENEDKIVINEEKEQVYIKKLIKEMEDYIKAIPYVSNSVLSLISNITDLNQITDIIAPYLQLSIDRLNQYLCNNSSVERLEMLLKDIYIEKESFNIERELDSRIKNDLDRNQKNYLLREKIKIIKQDLGEASIKDEDINKIRNKIKEIKASEKIIKRINDEVNRYETLSEASPEANIIRSYIDWMIELPWNKYTLDNDDLINVREKLDFSHSGLEKVKTRIVEYLAVKQMTNSLRGPIICLVGPPGVGKTSLAFSIANAMNRNFVKISVGGINDEAELIGHRRTYLGSNPGRIISSLKKAKSSNPVFLIDEIDKMTKNYKGDPASVLLEILDPEQNKYFSDNYIEEEYDLSKVMFIATANYIEDIPEALKDRLEIVMLSGYTEYEKIDIAKKYLLPKICKEHGVNFKGIDIKDETILKIIRCYTKEAGVRELDRLLSKIIRKIVTTLAIKRILVNKFIIDNKLVIEYLGKEKYPFINKLSSEIGIVNGLAYTSFGGDVLPIEVNYFKGNGNLVLTGSLGEIMKESALIALNYIKANYKYFKINYELLMQNDIHIHVPEGAIPKDGPSAGVALTSCLISALTNLKIPKTLAFTGEITLRGNVLAIGGLKEKSIGAYRNGIKKIIIPDGNYRDLDEIPSEIKNNIEFVPVKNYKDIYKILKEN